MQIVSTVLCIEWWQVWECAFIDGNLECEGYAEMRTSQTVYACTFSGAVHEKWCTHVRYIVDLNGKWCNLVENMC